MKLIEVQKDVELQHPSGALQTVSHEDFIIGRIQDAIFGRSMKTLLSAVAIREKTANRENGSIVLDNEDWALLKEAVETPTGGYNPAVAINCVGFMKAITEAKDV